MFFNQKFEKWPWELTGCYNWGKLSVTGQHARLRSWRRLHKFPEDGEWGHAKEQVPRNPASTYSWKAVCEQGQVQAIFILETSSSRTTGFSESFHGRSSLFVTYTNTYTIRRSEESELTNIWKEEKTKLLTENKQGKINTLPQVWKCR